MWTLFKWAEHPSYALLRNAINARFGLSLQEVRKAFLATETQAVEDAANYILRIEDNRVQLFVSVIQF